MKISRVGSSGKATKSRRKGKASRSDAVFAEHLKDVAGTTETAGLTETTPVQASEGVLAVQEVPNSTAGRSRARTLRYGEDMLDSLDEIRDGLLAGAISKNDVAELARTMRARRQRSDDSRLNEIIDEVELRAEVEIAKLTRES
ncbi:MAG: flagellar assembly protein FliX [Rhodospirillales bacterium]|jgi:hypothetical protein|nr:flagellar assembly protein FliX [Rhodospirillales bacterium]